MLQSKALLVSLNLSVWTARKLDKKVTNEVNTSHQAVADAGRYNKLLVDKVHLDPITKVTGAARTYHYSHTLAWGDSGERLLPSALYMEYVQQMSKFQMDYDTEVSKFMGKYQQVVDEAKIRLNGLYNAADYPSYAEVLEKFNWRTQFMPMPSTDIRLLLSDSDVEKIKSDVEGAISARLGDAMTEIWGRIKEQVAKVKDRTDSPDNVFRDSLFENIAELIELLPKLNVTDDADIAAICNDMQKLVASPELVRSNPAIRADVNTQATELLNKINGFFKP